MTVGSLLPECATPPRADILNAAGAAIDETLFAALFACSLTTEMGEAEAPAEETRPEERREEGAPAAPVVVTGFTVPVVWLALEAPLPGEPSAELCGDWKSGPPDALAEPVEPIPPGRADLQPRLPESLGLNLQAEPVVKAELAFAARLEAEPVATAELPVATRLEATEGRLAPRAPQGASALEAPQTVPQPEPDRQRAGAATVQPLEEVPPPSGNRTALSTSQPKPEPADDLPQPARPDGQPARLDREPTPAGDLPQPASPDRRPARRDREPTETRSTTPERLPQRRAAVEAAASPNLPPAGAGIWEPPSAFLRAAPVPGSTREPPTAPSELSTAPRNQTKPEALRDLDLVIPGRVLEGKKQDSIQVRVTDRAGEVRVAVHTGDSELAHSLRGQLGELVTRLEQTGYRTQTWQPAEISAGPARTGDARAPGGHEESSGFGRGNSGWGKQEARQQQRDSPDQPEWVKSLAGAGIKHFLAGME